MNQEAKNGEGRGRRRSGNGSRRRRPRGRKAPGQDKPPKNSNGDREGQAQGQKQEPGKEGARNGNRQGERSERRRHRRPRDRNRGSGAGRPPREQKKNAQQRQQPAGDSAAVKSAPDKRGGRPERQKTSKRRIWLEARDRETSPWFTARSEGGRPLRFSVLFGSKTWDPLARKPARDAVEGQWTKSVQLNQVHGDQVHLVGSTAHADTFPRDGDALVTRAPGLALVIATADCVPLLLADRRGTTVAAVHAGWRGIAAGLPGKVVQRLADAFQIQAGRFLAFIGPSISRQGYRVGDEVVQQVAAALPENGMEGVLHQEEDGPHLDLEAAVRAQLIAAGLHERSIYGGLPSTDDPADLFHSHRRSGGTAGRMHSMIYLHAPEEEEAPPPDQTPKQEPDEPQGPPERRRRPPRRAR